MFIYNTLLMKKAIQILLLSVSLLLAACKERSPETNAYGDMKTIAINDTYSMKRYDAVESYRYVPLQDTKRLIGNIDRLIVSDDRIVVVDRDQAQAVFIFDHNGNIIAEIAATGRGPNEYIFIDHVAIDTDNDRLAILDRRSRRVLLYGLDGKFIKSQKIPFALCGMEYMENGDILCITDAYARLDDFFSGRDDGNNLVFFTDREFNVKNSTLPNTATKRKISFTAPFVSQGADGLMVIPTISGIIYGVSNRDIRPLYRIDMSELGNVPLTDDMTDEEIAELGKRAPFFNGDFIAGDSHLLISIAIPPDQTAVQYCYDKQTGIVCMLENDTRRGDAMLADMAFGNIKAVSGKEYVADIPAYVATMIYPEGIENAALKPVNDNSNPILVFYTLKTPER